MREIFTSGTVGGALGNQCFYPEIYSSAYGLVRVLMTHQNILQKPRYILIIPIESSMVASWQANLHFQVLKSIEIFARFVFFD